MYVANTHLKPVIGIDIHFVNLPFPFVPLPHPYIGLVIDPFDYIPFIGATVKVNNVPRGNTDTMGMIITFVHIPFGAGFTLFPIIGHDSQNFFGSKRVLVDGAPMSGAGYMLMTCNDIGLPLSFRPGKKFIPIPSLYLPTSFCIPLQWGKPVMVGGPLVPNFSLMALLKAFAFGSFLKILGKAGGKMLKVLNNKVAKKFPSTKKLSNRLCKMGFEPVDLITGRVNYEYTDFDLPGPIPLSFTRNWDSDSSIKGPLGHGVHLCYDRCVQLWPEDGCLSVTMADGRQTVFPLLYHGESYYHPHEKITLRRKQNGHFLLDDHNESLYYHFNYEYQVGTWQLSYIENYSGNRIQLHYTGENLNAITDSAGRLLVFTLDNQARITQVTVKHRDQEQVLVSYTYNENGDLTEIADALNQVTSIEYRYHLMIQKTDRNGHSFYWEYDSKRRCIHTWGDGGVLEGFIQYRKGYNIVTNSLGENTTYYFEENNLCVQETDHYGNSRYTVYNDNFDVYRETDETGNIIGYIYDDAGRLKEKVLPDGNHLQFHYNENHQPTLIINADGSSQTFGYDNQRRLKFINHPNGRTITYDFNEQGQLAAIIESNNRKTLFRYDEDENLALIQLPDKSEAQWRYDALGRCIQSINGDGDQRFFEYDELNRVRTIHLPDGNTVKLQYNAYEEVTHATDKHHTVHYEYTPLGKVKKRTVNKRELNFFYDTEERLRTIINEAGKHYAFGYNKRGEIISETGFDGMQLRYQRDAIGRIIQVNRPGERFSRYEYDANGRIIRIEYNDETWKSFTYDKSGRVTRAENESSVVQFERDRAGNIITEKQQEYVIKSVYDKLGNRTHVTSSLGADIVLERNRLGFVTKMHAASGASWHSQISYNAAGQELQRVLPGDVSVEWQYDQVGRPQEQKVFARGKTQRWKKYTWDANNRLISVLDALSHGSTRFKYDALDTLAFAQYADNSILHRITDDAGNIYETKKRTDRQYSAAGALLESERYIYKYDEEGNLISKTNKTTNKKTRYVWYANGLLKKILKPDQTIEFTYDAFHRRIRKLVKNMAEHGKPNKGTITRWVWDGNVPLHEWNYSETAIPKTVINEWGEITYDREEPNPLNADVNDITWLFDADSLVPCAKIENKKTYSIVCDQLGTPNEAYDSDGKKVWECVTDIYGRISTLRGSKDFIPFRYQGQYEDEETGLYYNRFRYYAPEEGLYISQDPIGLAGNNTTQYSYVDDTNNSIDPYGLSGIGSWNEFLKATKGRFTKANSFAKDKNVMKDAASAWKEYKNNFNSTNTPVIGGLDDTTKCIGKPGLNVLQNDRWNLNVNDMWVQGGIDRKATFKLVSPQTHDFLWDDVNNRPKVYDRELKMLRKAGYVEIDDHMVHPDNVKKFKASCK